MGEIKAETIRRHQRAGLLHVRAENVAQRGMHQVRAGVVALVAIAAERVGDADTRSPTRSVSMRGTRCAMRPGDGVIGAVDFVATSID